MTDDELRAQRAAFLLFLHQAHLLQEHLVALAWTGPPDDDDWWEEIAGTAGERGLTASEARTAAGVLGAVAERLDAAQVIADDGA